MIIRIDKSILNYYTKYYEFEEKYPSVIFYY